LFLGVTGVAGLALACDGASSSSGDTGPDPASVAAAPTDDDAIALRRQRIRRYVLDGADVTLESFETEWEWRYAADIFSHELR
jgi:hypothetical protein